jgi:hypothetical protein
LDPDVARGGGGSAGTRASPQWIRLSRTGAREYGARLVVEDKSADEIYERLTDFLGERPDATEDERTEPPSA